MVIRGKILKYILKIYMIEIILTIAVVPNVIFLAATCVPSCGIIANASIFTWI